MSFQVIDEVLNVLNMQQYVPVFHEGRINDAAMADVVGDNSLHHILRTIIPNPGDMIRIMASFKVLYIRRRDENSGNGGSTGSSSGPREKSISSGSGTGSTLSFNSATSGASNPRAGPSNEGHQDPSIIQRETNRRRGRAPVDASMNFDSDGG